MEISTPLECQLDRKRLGTIEAKLDLTLGELKNLVSIDGPIGKLQKEIILNRQLTEEAHKRITVHDHEMESLSNRQWGLVIKAVGAVLGGGGLMVLAVKLLEAMGR